MAPWSRLAALLLVLCARPAFSGPKAGAPSVYPSPSAQWLAPIQTQLAGFAGQQNTPLASIAGLPADLQKQSLAPVIYELSRGLHLKPAEFLKLSPSDQSTALALAADSAKAELMQRSYKLVGEAQGLVWNGKDIDHESLGELYRVATSLQEVRKYYAPFLGEDEREAVEMAAVQSRARYLEAREAFVKAFGLATAEALKGGSQRQLAEGSGTFPSAKKGPAYTFTPSKNALKLLEEMRRNKSGWGQRDMAAIYKAFDFTYRDDGPHRVYFHPVFRQLGSEAVSRQNDLPPGYAHSAVKLIDEFLALAAPAPAAGLADASVIDLSAELPELPKLPEAKTEPVVKKPEKILLPDITLDRPAETIAARTVAAPVETVAAVEKKADAVPAPKEEPVLAPEPAPEKKKSGALDWLRNLIKRRG